MEIIQRFGLPLLLCSLPGPRLEAQAPLDEALKAARKADIPWVLVHRPEDGPGYTAQGDEVLLRLHNEGQLARTPLSTQAALDLWQSRGWDSQGRWLLVSASGEEIGGELGLAAGEKVLALLRAKGLVPRWEARRAFLKRHPENGDARQDELIQATLLVEARMEGLVAVGKAARATLPLFGGEVPSIALTETDPRIRERQADRVFGEVAEALAGVRSLAGWWRELIFSPSRMLAFGGADSPRLREVCGALARDLEQTLVRSGPELLLTSAWPTYQQLAGKPVRELPALPPLPGGQWPPILLMTGCLDTLKAQKDWEGALRLLDSVPAPDPRDPWTPQTWKNHRDFQGFLASARVLPLVQLGKAAEARRSLEDARFWAGSDWSLYARDSVFIFGLKVSGEAFIQEALQAVPLPDPPMPPGLPPLRLVLVGEPGWRAAWQRLQGSDALLPWGPGELQWSVLSPGDAEALRSRNGWGPEPRWAVLAGEDPVATGLQCPKPEVLAATLEQHGASRLQRLNAFLERNPERLDARHARMDLLKARLPEPRLEALLAEDARLASGLDVAGTLYFAPDAPWKPKAALWQWTAQQILPRIEQQLRSWPNSRRTWEAWIAWARFHPARPSVLALANTLTLWPAQGVWIGNLLPEVHQAVAEELRRDRNYPEMARWFGYAWAAVDKTPAAQLDPPDSWEYLKPEREKLRSAIVAPLTEALRFQRREEEARAVEATYSAMMNR